MFQYRIPKILIYMTHIHFCILYGNERNKFIDNKKEFTS